MCNKILIINKLQSVEYFNKARIEIERPFIGFPYGPLLLIKSLINLADPATGIVYNVSYLDLAKLIEINPAPGRKESGTPTKQTIRNYIKSIERECGNYFKVISEGQSLKFLFPEIPKVFNKLFENKEVNTEVNGNIPLENTGEKAVFEERVNTEVNTELNTPNNAVKKLFININNNNNNNTPDHWPLAKNNKQPIAADFYPNEATISRAIASGYPFATNPAIIQEFIDKNTAWGSTYADFNPIYLCFLAKYTHFQQSKQTEQNVKIRNITNERTSPKNNSYEAAMERVRQDNADAIEPTTQELFPDHKPITYAIEHEPHFMALG
ncbi:TPA: hypothetical protein I9284_003160 [Legionella pneumophila]|uniref:Uncharacterized protein n=1 Tax=Fluoribacter dumoffii TaxID=463 RepID=A0A377ITY1_9GAMM|nr:hypothetical protein [Fluoribacter dumoffii]STO91659.1 Uncharacterised protein [Fluoribacter dumoffii]HAT1865063.1 hypothetical protein [Legionella pneumophila]HAT4388934.1 hypothetical protein [Legionella pneumophila]HEM7045335.1 hypothetical protein [Legionella pneumophila]